MAIRSTEFSTPKTVLNKPILQYTRHKFLTNFFYLHFSLTLNMK